MGNVVSVAIKNATRKYDKEYNYKIPEHYNKRLVPGMRVIVPFGRSNRSVEAYILDVGVTTTKMELKEIEKVLDKKPVLDEKMLKLVHWMKNRYICSYSDAIKCMLPPGIGVEATRIINLKSMGGNLTGDKKKIIDCLGKKRGGMEYKELEKIIGGENFEDNIRHLIKGGNVEIEEKFSQRISKKKMKAAYLAKSKEEIIYDIENNKIKNIKHIRILEMLIENEYVMVNELVRFVGVYRGMLETLRKRMYIDFKDIDIIRDPTKNKVFEKTLPPRLTSEQGDVVSELKKALDRGKFDEVLLHGITGSGKTEVYLRSIEHCINLDKNAIVMVPEISLTPQMIERFKGRFGEKVAVIHSRLSLGERYDQWRLIKNKKIRVVVGARSAVFAPLENIGIIIIDEEHESSYKSETIPKYHAADISRQRCIFEKAILLYGSATPSIETYYRAKANKIKLLEMTKRANKMLLPKVEIIDMRSELEKGNRSVFSEKLSFEISENLKNGQQTIVFLNRRGYASFVLCRSCGFVLMCPYCNISLTYHSHEDRVICHYCGFTVKNPKKCPKCQSNHIRNFGSGTQKIEEEIKRQFRGCTVIRMDADTTMGKNSHEEILDKFRKENINIMVGTQMIAKGHDFPNVTLVGVLAADSILNTGDYKATERTFQLITQVAGRAGRGKCPGRVMVQTYNTESYSIICACKQDYNSFFNKEILIRRKLGYPPFVDLALVVLSGGDDSSVEKTAISIGNLINSYATKKSIRMQMLGPGRAPLSKIRGRYRWRIIIKCAKEDELLGLLTNITEQHRSGSGKKSVILSVDINPFNML